MYRQFSRFGIDISKDPILVYPTLHYQNGGVLINSEAATNIPGLFAAGEVEGGVHGRNRFDRELYAGHLCIRAQSRPVGSGVGKAIQAG